MINYKDYEEQVYNWLNQKHDADPNFTFSLRMKGSKGAELDYFIGTKNLVISAPHFGQFWFLLWEESQLPMEITSRCL